MVAYNPFENAEAIRDQVTLEQQKQIASLYKQWADELDERADWLAKHSTSWSSGVQRTQYDMLKRQMQQTSHQVSNGVYTLTKNGMFKVADAVVKDSVDWMSSFGFSGKGLDAAFEYVPASVVNSLVTGSVYGNAGSWSLSKAIWSDSEKALRDIYQIMAGGLAKNMSVDEIARDLKAYVSPNVAFDWQGPTGLKIYKHKVDYNAQRLARTLTQHTYQQSMVAVVKDNPFIEEFVWVANGSRVCPICADRDGTHYKKDKLPLDHPNGMCVMEPVIADDMVDKLADWVNSEDGKYPEIDEFSKKFGYEPGKMSSLGLQGIKDKYGNSSYKALNTWLQKLPKDVQAEVKALKNQSGLKWDDWYKQNIYLGGSSSATVNGEAAVAKSAAKSEVTAVKGVVKSEAATIKNVAAKQADNADDILKMAAKYEKNIGEASNGFAFMGKMSKQSMLDNLYDDEIEELSEFAAKKYGLPIGTGKQKDKAIARLLDDMFSEVDKLKANGSVHEQLGKYVAKDAANAANAATGSLKDRFKEFSSKTWDEDVATIKRLKASEKAVFDGWSKHALSGLRSYTGAYYSDVNAWLRHENGFVNMASAHRYNVPDSLARNVKELVDQMNKEKTSEAMMLRRGTNRGELAGLFMQGDFRDNYHALREKSVEELNAAFKGMQGTYSGFTSTSSVYSRGFHDNVEVIFDAPEGTHGVSVLTESKYKDKEGEFLLAPGTRVECTGIEHFMENADPWDERIRVFLKIITD